MWYLTHNALHGFPPKFNMAANRASTIEGWGNVFEELLRLMTDYEAFYDSTDLRLRENKVIRMESALLALQQVITLVIERRLDCASVLQEIFNNVRILFLELTTRRETQTGSPYSNLAIYSLEMPKVERSGRPGRTYLRTTSSSESELSAISKLMFARGRRILWNVWRC